MRAAWIVVGIWAAAAAAAASAAPAPVIANDEVTVTDLRLAKGEAGAATPQDEDVVIMFMEGGRVRTVTADGKSRSAVRQFGDAVFVPKGSGAVDTVIGGGPVREIVVALKDRTMPRAENRTGLPLSFPRTGTVKALENARVVVWRYSNKLGPPTIMHFHDKDTIVAYQTPGTLASYTPDGKATARRFEAGEIRFNKGDRSHSEQLIDGRESDMILELK